ncbi:MAG: hypothetical protein LBV12_08240 [Puniceicoccales bacterium]|jgi:hypothetical protein|nr:hypothetical protein [Puniceicoccales bacterium]
MAAWLPLLKASLPYLAEIARVAIPVFTAKRDAGRTDPLVARQIEELQTAATKNAESIHVLAEKLQQTIQGIDEAAINLQKELAKLRLLLYSVSAVAVAALAVASWALLR